MFKVDQESLSQNPKKRNTDDLSASLSRASNANKRLSNLDQTMNINIEENSIGENVVSESHS